MATPQRLVFGDVAELYDRHRPTYPPKLIDDLIADAGLAERRIERPRALEVGAGTGKATVLFGARGVPVLAVEPSPRMAALARRNCARYRNVEIVESDFERWDPQGVQFDLLYSAQAWHWIDPDVRYRHARRALANGGLLAAFWNRPAWGRSELRTALIAVYDEVVPDLSRENGMHPGDPSPADEEDWTAEIAAVSEFARPAQRGYRWSQEYTAAEYIGLLATLSDIQLLDEAVRDRLLARVGETIVAHGGELVMPMVTLVHLARAV